MSFVFQFNNPQRPLLQNYIFVIDWLKKKKKGIERLLQDFYGQYKRMYLILLTAAVTTKTKIRRQLLRDFELFTRQMCLQYIFHGKNKEPHPFHVKSNWMPLVQQSAVLERYLESVKTQLPDIKITQPKNTCHNEMAALKELKNNCAIIQTSTYFQDSEETVCNRFKTDTETTNGSSLLARRK